MAKIDSVNNKSQELTIDPGTGDSFVQFDINGTGEFRIGVDDDDSDKFKLSVGSALGTNDTFVMSSDGERTMPLQPAATLWFSAGANLVTGDGSEYTIIWDSELFDQNNDFNTGTGTWTAPVTGRYRIILSPWFDDVNSSSFSSQNIKIVTSNRTYKGGVRDAFLWASQQVGEGQSTTVISVLADMDAGDTCTTTMTVSGGTKTINTQSVGSSTPRGWASMALVC